MNQKNNKNSEPHVLTLKLTDKFDLRMVKKKCFSIKTQYLLHMEKHKKARMKKKKKIEISPPTWNHKLELPDRSYSVSDIQDYFKYFFSEKIDNP